MTPYDPKAKAVELAEKLDAEYGLFFASPPHHFEGLIESALREAIEAERERCAKVAESNWKLSVNVSEKIANAIREGK